MLHWPCCPYLKAALEARWAVNLGILAHGEVKRIHMTQLGAALGRSISRWAAPFRGPRLP
jgi:hypothetical protein